MKIKQMNRKVLHMEFETCNPCPYMAIVGGFSARMGKSTIVACKNREKTAHSGKNSRVILEQPRKKALAEVEIPDWCPLDDYVEFPDHES